MTNIEALKNLYVANGGDRADVEDMNLSSEVINALAGYIGIKDINVQPEKGSTEYLGVKASQMQTGLVVADGAITGTLKFIEGGIAPSGPLAGDGNFMFLKFVDPNSADKVEVGLVPSAGTGFVELDIDMNAVFKVAGEIEGVAQVLKVKTTVGSTVKVQTFDLSGLTLEES